MLMWNNKIMKKRCSPYRNIEAVAFLHGGIEPGQITQVGKLVHIYTQWFHVTVRSIEVPANFLHLFLIFLKNTKRKDLPFSYICCNTFMTLFCLIFANVIL